jgi:hypothetical protein
MMGEDNHPKHVEQFVDINKPYLEGVIPLCGEIIYLF